MEMSDSDKKTQPARLDGWQLVMAIVIAVAIFLIAVWILQVAWNHSMPRAFPGGVGMLSFTGALALLLVARILLAPWPVVVQN
jgi:protein-S-isoprenylcysteine O-methyltransferase Ste14